MSEKTKKDDWTKPAAMAIPKEGYFKVEQGRYGPIFPKTPACYGFTLIAKVKKGLADTVRAHGKTLENAVAADPDCLDILKLHYLRWVLFDIGEDTYFMYQGILTPTLINTPRMPWLSSQKRVLPRYLLISRVFLKIGKRISRHSSSLSEITNARAFWNMANTPL